MSYIILKDYTNNNYLFIEDFKKAINDDARVAMVKKTANIWILHHYPEASPYFIKEIINIFPKDAIHHIKNPSDEILEYNIRLYPEIVVDIKDLSDDLLILALNLKPYIYDAIKNPSPKVRMRILELWAGAIQYLKNPTDEEKILVITKHPDLFDLIKKPTVEMQYMMLPYFREKKTTFKDSQTPFLWFFTEYDPIFLQTCHDLCIDPEERKYISQFKSFVKTAAIILDTIKAQEIHE